MYLRTTIGEFLAAAAVLAGTVFPAGAAPSITFDKTTHDFGTRRSSETVRVVFTIRNQGDKLLEITNVKTSCGCTAASLDESILQPDESAPLVVTFSLQARSGPQNKSVTVFSNDPQAPVSRLVLRGKVVKGPSWTPRSIFFGRIRSGDTVTRKADLSGFSEPPAVQGVTVDSNSFQAKWVPESGKEGHLQVQTNPPLEVGSHRARVEVETDHPDYPVMPLPVFVYVTSQVRVIPSTLFLREGNERQGKVTITLRGRLERFRVKRVEHPSGLTVNAERQAPNQWTVRVEGLRPPAQFHGKKIQIETDVKGMENINIPIRVGGMQPPNAISGGKE